DGENMLVCRDPKNHEELAGLLRFVIDDPQKADEIGERGHEISRDIENYSEYIDGYENVILRLGRADPQSRADGRPPGFGAHIESRATVESGEDLSIALADSIPFTSRILSPTIGSLVSHYQEVGHHPNGNKLGDALAFCEFLQTQLKNHSFESDVAYIEDLLKFETADLSL